MDLSGRTKGTIKLKTLKSVNEDYENVTFNDFKLQLGEDDNEKVYVEDSHSTAKKWGQLKLMATELLFLSIYSDSDTDIVIYAGAAPGSHIFTLSKLFNHLEFHLYDTAKFDSRLKDLTNVQLYNSYFTEDHIQRYNSLNKKCMFISDIRNLSYDRNKMNMRVNQDMIWNDMMLQQSWLGMLQFTHASLKFRLPYPEEFVLHKYGDEVEYLDGVLLKQAYAGPYSTECRLIVDGSKLSYRKWNLKSYEQKMFYHNKIVRQMMTYKHLILNNTENLYPDKVFQHKSEPFMLTRDYDSMFFGTAVIKYMKKIGTGVNTCNFKKLCDYILSSI